jgi:hypothetical protein
MGILNFQIVKFKEASACVVLVVTSKNAAREA